MQMDPAELNLGAGASVDAVRTFIQEIERVPEGHRSPVFLAGTIQLALLLLTTDLRAAGAVRPARGETEPELRLALFRALLGSLRHFAAELDVTVDVHVSAPAPARPRPS